MHALSARSLHALGFDGVPLREPLLYPGRLVERPMLLADGQLLELGVVDDRLGAWPVLPHGEKPGPAPGLRSAPRPAAPRAVALDTLLDDLGHPRTGDRYPVLAVGSNAAPGQLSHKLTDRGLPDTVPLVPVTVHGLSVALSAHISAPGYVAASPVVDPGARTPLVVTWLDAGQLAAVDATELTNYRRAFLPGDDFPLELPSGRRLGGAYLYHSMRGVLASSGGQSPRPGGVEQSQVLAGLLADSPRLRELLGPEPHDWVRLAGADAALRARGAELFAAEGWLLPEEGFAPYDCEPGDEIPYRELFPRRREHEGRGHP